MTLNTAERVFDAEGNCTDRRSADQLALLVAQVLDFARRFAPRRRHDRAMNYCSQCGKPVVLKVPPDDTIPRYVCESCSTIHYQNPRMVVGCVPEWEGRILLCLRAIEPRSGYWTLPAGFMENQETLAGRARREAQEEALADVEIGGLLAVINVPHANQVHLFFRGRLVEGRYGVGHESRDARLYAEAEPARGAISPFPSVDFTLRASSWIARSGAERTHVTTVQRIAAPD